MEICGHGFGSALFVAFYSHMFERYRWDFTPCALTLRSPKTNRSVEQFKFLEHPSTAERIDSLIKNSHKKQIKVDLIAPISINKKIEFSHLADFLLIISVHTCYWNLQKQCRQFIKVWLLLQAPMCI